MNTFYACAFVAVFLTACGAHAYKNTHARPQLLDPPGYPPAERATETAQRVLTW